MDKKSKSDSSEKKDPPKLVPKFNFSPQSFSGGRAFKPQTAKVGFNPGSFKTQHKG